MRLILASTSPRRHQLLAGSGLAFEVVPVAVDERPLPGEPAATYVRRLAVAKGEAAMHCHHGAVVLSADTIVSIDGELLGKPQTPDEARQMLTRLSGKRHEVITGVAVLPGNAADGRVVDVVTSRVLMRPFTAQSIEWYIATGEPFDKAGAYAVQGLGAALVESVEGSYTNVVGLPLTETLALLRRFGITVAP